MNKDLIVFQNINESKGFYISNYANEITKETYNSINILGFFNEILELINKSEDWENSIYILDQIEIKRNFELMSKYFDNNFLQYLITNYSDKIKKFVTEVKIENIEKIIKVFNTNDNFILLLENKKIFDLTIHIFSDDNKNDERCQLIIFFLEK